MRGMKALLNFRVKLLAMGLLAMGLLLAAGLLTSCETKQPHQPNQPRRDEPSPFAPQWKPFHHYRH
jgi:hypothetical protein